MAYEITHDDGIHISDDPQRFDIDCKLLSLLTQQPCMMN